MKKILNSKAVNYALIGWSPLFMYMIGMSLVINFKEIGFVVLFYAILSFITFLALATKEQFNTPFAYTKAIKLVLLALSSILLIFGGFKGYNINKEEVKIQTEKKVIEEKNQQRIANMTPQEKVAQQELLRKQQENLLKKQKEDYLKTQTENYEKDTLSKMTRSQKEEYLKEKELFKTMTPEQIEVYKQEKALEEVKTENRRKQVDVAISLMNIVRQNLKVDGSLKIKSVAFTNEDAICINYKAQNAFGVFINSSIMINPSLDILQEDDSNKFVKNWNRYCTKPGRDMTRQVAIKGGFSLDRY